MTIEENQYSSEETKQRLRKTLRAAFNMKPTPLKAIPKKYSKDQPPRPNGKPRQAA